MWESADSTQCEIVLSLATHSFCGKSSALIDAKQWAAFINEFDRVAKGESHSAELHAGRAGLSLQILDRGDAGSVVLVCTLSHPSTLDPETAIYATGAEFTVTKEELCKWLHESSQKDTA